MAEESRKEEYVEPEAPVEERQESTEEAAEESIELKEETEEKSGKEGEASEPEKEKKPEVSENAKVETDKNRLAQQKVVAARNRVLSAEEEIEECLRNIEEDLRRFEEYEKEDLVPVVLKSRQLLEEVGAGEIPENSELFPVVELENPEEEKLRIEDISSGKVGAFFVALLGGIITLFLWYLFAVKKAAVDLIPQGVPDLHFFSKLAASIANAFGQGENASVGAAIVVVTVLVVMWLVYAVLVAIRTSQNVRRAEEVEEAAGFYCRKKEECKEKMKEVREHLENLDKTVRKYEVVLAEINAGLNRALHIEGVHDFNELHEKTKASIRELQGLLKELDALLATPMAQSGVLTPESVEALRRAKRVINDHILHIYS